MKDFAFPMPAHPPSSRIYYMLNKVGYIFGKKNKKLIPKSKLKTWVFLKKLCCFNVYSTVEAQPSNTHFCILNMTFIQCLINGGKKK